MTKEKVWGEVVATTSSAPTSRGSKFEMETDRPADADVLDLDCGEDVDVASGFLVWEENDNKGHHLIRLYSP